MNRLKRTIQAVAAAAVAAGAYMLGHAHGRTSVGPRTRAERKAARKAAIALEQQRRAKHAK